MEDVRDAGFRRRAGGVRDLTAAYDLLRELEALGADLCVVDDRIKVSAPSGVITAIHRERMREFKGDLLTLLKGRAASFERYSAVIPIKTGTGAWPVFGVPGHNGDVFCYRGLASYLASDRALFGLQPPGLDGQAGPMSRVEDIAAYFAEQIIASRPEAPVVIAGYCAGGSVAFELARQLQAQGQKVGLLVLIGAPYPAAYRKLRYLLIRVREYLRRIRQDPRRLRKLANSVLISNALQSLRSGALASEVSEGLTAEQDAQRQAVEKATVAAAALYRPAFSDIPMLQCLPGRPWQRLGVGHNRWEKLTNIYSEFVGPDEIPQESMLKQPNARLIASLIEGCVDHLADTRAD